jgi:hypothetical protein
MGAGQIPSFPPLPSHFSTIGLPGLILVPADFPSDRCNAQCFSLSLSSGAGWPLIRAIPSSTSMGLRCISCPPLRYIRPRCEGGYRLLPLPTRLHRARMIMVACVITTITRHRLSIIWHQHSVAVIIRTADISQLLCRYSTCFPIEQNIFPKINMDVSFRSVDLLLCYYLFIKTHLSINQFTNLLSRNTWAPETKSTYIVFCLSQILSVHLSRS